MLSVDVVYLGYSTSDWPILYNRWRIIAQAGRPNNSLWAFDWLRCSRHSGHKRY